MNLERGSAALSAFVVGAAVFVVVVGVKVSPTYADFVVGNIAWYAGSKFQDLVVWPVCLLTAFLAYVFLVHVLSSLRRNQGSFASLSLASQLIWSSIPLFAAIGNLFLRGVYDPKLVYISASGVVFLGFLTFIDVVFKKKPDPQLLGITFLCIVLISLVPLEILLLLGRAPVDLIGEIRANYYEIACYVLFFTGLFVGIIAHLKSTNLLKNNLPNVLLLSQIGLPLFFLAIYPARLVQPSGEILKYNTTLPLKIVVIFLVVVGVWDVVRRFVNHRGREDWIKLLSPLAVFGLVFAMKCGNTVLPHIYPDDYHFGESLLGFWSYLSGVIPYVGYVPAHGLIDDDFRQMVSYLFYDGTASSVLEAGRLCWAILGMTAFISIYYFSGSLVLAVTALLLLEGRLAWLFFIPFICVWLNSSIQGRPAVWLSVWMITSPIIVLGIPPQGLLLVVAFSLLAGKLALEQIRMGDRVSWILVSSTAVLMLAIFTLSPLLSMLLGAVHYVLENGPINQIAYGVPWDQSWTGGPNSGFMFEAIRMSWVFVAALCLYLIKDNWGSFKNTHSMVYPATAILIFVLLLIPYSMGRIDPGNLSRSGAVSFFSWAVLFPLLVWNLVSSQIRAVVVLISAFMCSLLGSPSFSLTTLTSAVSGSIYTPTLTDATKSGLPNIGLANIDGAHWNRLVRLDSLLKSKLEPNETYLDLTSRNAHYFYFNRLPSLFVTAPYNLVSPSQQRRAIESLGNPPRIALFQADNIIHDGGGLALRNPLLYRFVVDNYSPRFESGFIVGYMMDNKSADLENSVVAELSNITNDDWKDGLNRSGNAIVLSDPVLISMLNIGDKIRFSDGNEREIEKIWVEGSALWFDGGAISLPHDQTPHIVEILTHSRVVREYRTSLLQRSFSVSDYGKIPVAWGNSAGSLKAKMTSIKKLEGVPLNIYQIIAEDNKYTVTGDDPQLNLDISRFSLSGHDAGLLRFDFVCEAETNEPRLQIFWWGDGREGPFEQSSVRFTADNGTLIVPLDASAWWLRTKKLKGIRIDLDNPSACRAFRIDNIELYQREL